MSFAFAERRMKLKKILPFIKTLEKDCMIAPRSNLVIDAKSFYKNTYRDSGCPFILGGEYDRYAHHLRKIFQNFKDINVTCYVVFSGTSAVTDMDCRHRIHQKIINKTILVDPTKPDKVFCEPIFVKDVFKEVLNELNIRFGVCECDNVVDMIDLARYYGCPLLTKNVEYSLFGVSCISPHSLIFEPGCITCQIYDTAICVKTIRLGYYKLAVFIVLMNGCNNYLQDLEELIKFRKNNVINRVHRYIYRHQTIDSLLSDIGREMSSSRYELFLNDYKKIKDLLNNYRNLKSLLQKHVGNTDMGSVGWFVKGVITDRIASCYVNLIKSGTFSGSWLISDNSKEDPILPSMNIVRFAFELLTNFRGANITFLGRVGTRSKAWEIFHSVGFKRPEGAVGDVFGSSCSMAQLPDYFTYFFQVELPGLSFDALKLIPADCRVLMLALVYYSVKINDDNIALVYSVMLSYIMLGPVARATGLLKRSNLTLMETDVGDSDVTTADGLVIRDCYAAARALLRHFYYGNDIAETFDRGVLHTFAEFQHCLQQLNYLNRLCGNGMPHTVYHRCLNATFMYNMYFELCLEHEPLVMAQVKSMLMNIPSVLKYFMQLVRVFKFCLKSLTRPASGNSSEDLASAQPPCEEDAFGLDDLVDMSAIPDTSSKMPASAVTGQFGAGFVQAVTPSVTKKRRMSGAQKKKRALERRQAVECASLRADLVEVTDLSSLSKKQIPSSQSFKGANVGHRVAVIADGEAWRLTKETANSVTDGIFELIEVAPVLPQMDLIKFAAGALHFVCDGADDVRWLCALNGRNVGGVKVRVVDAKSLPKPVQLAWKTKNSDIKDNSRVLAALQRYNPGLTTSEWKVVGWHEDEDERGCVRRIVLVDQQSADYIEARGYCLRAGAEKNYFKLLKEPKKRSCATCLAETEKALDSSTPLSCVDSLETEECLEIFKNLELAEGDH